MSEFQSTQLLYRPDARRRKGIGHYVKDSLSSVYNPHKNEYFGRTPISWGFCALFYFVVWGCIFILFAICMAIHLFLIVDANYPERMGQENLMKYNPGLSMRPLPNLRNPLIRFVQGYPSTYKVFIDQMQGYVDQYDNDKQVGENFMDCSNIKERPLFQWNKVCRFNIDDFGDDCTWKEDYGYDEGNPCVLLKLNAIYTWLPYKYQPNQVPKQLTDHLQSMNIPFDNDTIHVTCEGEGPLDKENIGRLSYHPSWGFKMAFFPNLNQEGYRAPAVMVRFEQPVNGIVIKVWCRAWAPNIYHHREDMQGSVRFEILID